MNEGLAVPNCELMDAKAITDRKLYPSYQT